jgi:hypothetical protein
MSQTLIRQLEMEAQRQALFTLGVMALLFIITMAALYYVIRAAIRDGIRDSGLVQTWQRTVIAAKQHTGDTLPPDMRADR